MSVIVRVDDAVRTNMIDCANVNDALARQTASVGGGPVTCPA